MKYQVLISDSISGLSQAVQGWAPTGYMAQVQTNISCSTNARNSIMDIRMGFKYAQSVIYVEPDKVVVKKI